jgi:hypothetical protein
MTARLKTHDLVINFARLKAALHGQYEERFLRLSETRSIKDEASRESLQLRGSVALPAPRKRSCFKRL